MENGKTIKQIADELGVSKQAVHQKRKGKELSTVLPRLRQRLTVLFTVMLTL